MLTRILLMRDIELYAVRKTLCGEILYYILFLDHRRESRYSDFSFINGFEEEDFESRENYVQAVVLYNNYISENEKDKLFEIASGFLECKDNCDWSIKYIQVDFNDLRAVNVNHKVLIEKLSPILKQVGFSKDISNLNLDSFKYLSQEYL